MRIKVVPKTKEQLRALANPATANQPEALPWVLYSTKLYTSATTLTLSFFDKAEGGDLSLTNMEAPSSITDPKWFEIHYIGADILQDTSTAAAVGGLGTYDDVAKLTLVGRPYWQIAISDKVFGPFPFSFLHGSGGPTGIGYGWGTIAAGESVQGAVNGIFDGGFHVGGSIILPPNTGFTFPVTWSAAQTLQAGNPYIRVWMAGVMHRRVL